MDTRKRAISFFLWGFALINVTWSIGQNVIFILFNIILLIFFFAYLIKNFRFIKFGKPNIIILIIFIIITYFVIDKTVLNNANNFYLRDNYVFVICWLLVDISLFVKIAD